MGVCGKIHSRLWLWSEVRSRSMHPFQSVPWYEQSPRTVTCSVHFNHTRNCVHRTGSTMRCDRYQNRRNSADGARHINQPPSCPLIPVPPCSRHLVAVPATTTSSPIGLAGQHHHRASKLRTYPGCPSAPRFSPDREPALPPVGRCFGWRRASGHRATTPQPSARFSTLAAAGTPRPSQLP